MALTLNSAAQLARDLITSESEAVVGLDIPEIIAMCPLALEVFARGIAKSPDFKTLQKDFAATPIAGVFDLTTLADIIFDAARSQVRVAATGLPVLPFDNFNSMALSALPTDQVFFSRDGYILRFLNTDGSLSSYGTALKIMANYIPTIAELITASMQYSFVQVLAGVAQQQLTNKSKPGRETAGGS